MTPRQLRPAPSAPRRAVAPFHSGPQAASGNTGPAFVNSPHAALLIDFDNVTMGIRSDLQAELRTLLSNDIVKGKLTVQRAYADWRRYPQYILPLTESSIDLIWAPAYGSAKKNATDIRLAIDALELVFTRPEIGTFILLSGDSDFSSLVIKLKEYGKYVIGVGIRESSSDLLVMNCDEYYSYNALAGLVKSGEDESTRWDPWQLVTEALTRMKRNDDVMRSDRLKQVMQEIDASFDEKDLGMPKFSRFVQEAAHRGLVRVAKLESGQLEVDLPDATENGDTPSEKVVAKDESGEVRRDRDHNGDRGGRRGRRGRGREGAEPRQGTTAETTPSVEPSSLQPSHQDAGKAGGHPTQKSSEKPDSQAAQKPTVQPAQKPAGSAAAGTVAPEGLSSAIGISGERLTRTDAFSLVRRAVESLVKGNEAVRASLVRKRAFELLGRNSESLSERGFERILKDAHDADMIDLRRRGNDFEVARAVEEASIVDQLRTAEGAQKEATTTSSSKATFRGMAPRGIGGKSPGAGKGAAELPADLLRFGVVAGPKDKPSSAVTGEVGSGARSAPAPETPKPVEDSGKVVAAVGEDSASDLSESGKAAAPGKRVSKSAKKGAPKAAAKTATKAPAKAAPSKTAGKSATRSSTRSASKTATKTATKTASRTAAKTASGSAAGGKAKGAVKSSGRTSSARKGPAKGTAKSSDTSSRKSAEPSEGDSKA